MNNKTLLRILGIICLIPFGLLVLLFFISLLMLITTSQLMTYSVIGILCFVIFICITFIGLELLDRSKENANGSKN
jgi:sugar phosphate permease